MSNSRFVKDHGLSFRMGWTMFLNGLVYVVLILAIWWIFGGSLSGVVFALALSIGLFWFQWYCSDSLAMKSMGAREVSEQQSPDLHRIVDRLCQLADTTKPRVAYSPSPVPNAFATGRSPKHSVVCVTQGLLDTLEPAEVEAVLAHELSHVAHRDVTVMTVAGTTGVLAGLMIRSSWFAGRSRNDNGVPIQLVMVAVGMVVYTLSFVLIRSLSRYRELAADRAAAFLTGAPSTLASALVKISGEMGKIPSQDLRAAGSANHLALVPAINGKDVRELFSTHPSLEKRLAQLADISGQLSTPM